MQHLDYTFQNDEIDQAETDVRQIKSYLLHLTINSILLFLKFKKPLKISIF